MNTQSNSQVAELHSHSDLPLLTSCFPFTFPWWHKKEILHSCPRPTVFEAVKYSVQVGPGKGNGVVSPSAVCHRERQSIYIRMRKKVVLGQEGIKRKLWKYIQICWEMSKYITEPDSKLSDEFKNKNRTHVKKSWVTSVVWKSTRVTLLMQK